MILLYSLSLFLMSFISNWMSLVFFLEINFFLIFLVLKNKSIFYKFSILLKYFFTQTILSLILFFVMIKSSGFFIFILIMIKLAFPPFHFWLIELVKGVSFFKFLILITFQKFPFIILLFWVSLFLEIKYFFVFILLSVGVSIKEMFLSGGILFLLFYSSVNNFSYLLFLTQMSSSLFWLYFCMYLAFNFTLLLLFFWENYPSEEDKMGSFPFLFVIFSGIPFSPLFLVKMFFLMKLFLMSFWSVLIMMVILISYFIYFKWVSSYMMFFPSFNIFTSSSVFLMTGVTFTFWGVLLLFKV